MVIMEAAILGLPVIATKFATVTDALPGPGLHIVDPTDEALARGMLDYLDGAVAAPVFDFRSYNVAAVAEFAAAIEHRADDPSDTSSGQPATAGLKALTRPRSLPHYRCMDNFTENRLASPNPVARTPRTPRPRRTQHSGNPVDERPSLGGSLREERRIGHPATVALVHLTDRPLTPPLSRLIPRRDRSNS